MNEITFEEDVTVASFGKIAEALAQAQCAMANPKFDTQNPFFKNKYASLAAVRDAVVPVLAKHGICLTQDLRTGEGQVACTTTLTHSSGQQMVFGPYTLPVSKQDAQGFGSASTYARRYQLMAVCGVVGDADDDAEHAVGRGNGISPNDAVNSGKEPTMEAKLIASNFQAAVKLDNADKVKEIHAETNAKGHDLYQDAWRLLDSKTRSSIKRMLGQQ